MKKQLTLFIVLFIPLLFNGSVFSQNCSFICNSSFDSTVFVGYPAFPDSSEMPCWKTTANDGQFEVWNNGYNGVPSYSGNQFLEMNAYFVSTIYQDIVAAPGYALTIEFAHRGRGGVDTMSLAVGPVGGPYTTLGTYADSTFAWGFYSENYVIPNLGNNYSIRFNSIYAALSNPQIGNFLDAVTVCQTNVGFDNDYPIELIEIYPTLVEDNISIEIPNQIKFNLDIFDVNGKNIFKQTFLNSTSINFSQLPKGLYFYEITFADHSGFIKTGKFIKN